MASSTPDQETLQRCYQVFAEGDHAAAAQRATDWLREGRPASLELLQVLLISLQRLGAADRVAQLSPQVLSATGNLAWENALLRLTLGLTPEGEVLGLAREDRQRCQAHYYAGARLLTLGQTVEAERHFASCAATGVSCLEQQLALGEIGRAVARMRSGAVERSERGEHAPSVQLATQARDLAREHLGENHALYADALATLGEVLDEAGDLAAAEAARRESVAAHERAYGAERGETAIACNNLGTLLRDLGRPAEAEPLQRRALAIDEVVRGPRDPKIAHRLNNLALVLLIRGELGEAKALLARAWRLKAGAHDLTSARILWTRLAAALCAGEDPGTFIGLLKTVLARPDLTTAGGVAARWRIASTLDQLRPHVAPAAADLLAALGEAMNERTRLTGLGTHALWHDQDPLPSRTPWPDAARPRSAGWQSQAIFISSTFADMQAERDHLRDEVFPVLAERLRARRYHLEPIDLRWGVEVGSVADPGQRELEILKVCLDEIKRSRPFLVGLLGDRYGWVPPAERMQAATREAGLEAEMAGKSVTALELEFGLLESPAQRERSHVYLRQPLPYDGMHPAVAARFSQARDPAPEARAAVPRLESLKARVRAQLPGRVREYAAAWDADRQRVGGLGSWGQQVLEDLWQDLDEETRPRLDTVPLTWQEEEQAALEEFVEERGRGFVGRKAVSDRLVALASSPAAEGARWGICVVGEAGGGKSALFAHLCRRLEGETDVLLLAHAAGIGPRAGQVDAMLRRWCAELADAVGVADPSQGIPDAEKLAEAFAQLLGRASVQQRVVLLVDALNQFERTPRAQYLTWLPRLFPASARLVATAIPGTESDALAARAGCALEALPPLDAPEAEEIASSVCRRHHRTLSPEVRGVLLEKHLADGRLAAGNPLWLEIGLEELNLLDADDFARAEAESGATYDEKLLRMMRRVAEEFPPDVEGLYGNLLARTERRQGVARARAFAALIAVSRHGWRESDLRALVPAAAPLFGEADSTSWTDLQLAALRRGFRAHLRQRGAQAQWDFFHQQMCTAVARRVLLDAGTTRRLHRLIADHLLALPPEDVLRASETMVHLIGADDRPRAAQRYAEARADGSSAADTAALADFIRSGQGALKWVCALPSEPDLTLEQRWAIANRFNFHLHDALANEGRWPERRALLESAQRTFESLAGDERFDKARAERGWSVSLNKMGDLSLREGAPERARGYFEQGLEIAERLARALPNDVGAQRDWSVSLERMGDLSQQEGAPERARGYFQQGLEIRERLARALPNDVGAQRDWWVSLNQMGDLSLREGAPERARGYFEQGLEIAERLARALPNDVGAQRDWSVSLGRMGDLSQQEGAPERARGYFEQGLEIAERLARALPNDVGAQRDWSVSLERMGDLSQQEGAPERARGYFQQGLEIRERLARALPNDVGAQRDWWVSLNQMGDLSLREGAPERARGYFEQGLEIAERLARALPNDIGAQRDWWVSLERMGDLSLQEGAPERARGYFEQGLEIAERLARALPNDVGAQRDWSVSLERMGDLSQQEGAPERARGYFQQGLEIRERLARALPNDVGAQRDWSVSLNKMGDLSLREGAPERARGYLQQGLEIRERLARALPNDVGAQRDWSVSLNKMGDLSLREGAPERARGYLEQSLEIAERLARVLPNDVGAQRDWWVSLERMGDLSLQEGAPERARGYFERGLEIAERLARALPNDVGAQRDWSVSLNKMGDLSLREGAPERARGYLEQSLEILERLARALPNDVGAQRDWWVSLERMGDLSLREGAPERARGYFEQGLEIAERLARALPNDVGAQRDWSVSLNKMGDLSLREGAPERARGYLEQDLEIAERLARALPNDVGAQRDWSVSLNKMGDLSLREGAPERARGYLEQSLEILERLARALPNDVGAQRDLVAALWNLTVLHERTGAGEAARRHRQRCREVLRAMQSAGMHLDPPMLQLLAQLTTVH